MGIGWLGLSDPNKLYLSAEPATDVCGEGNWSSFNSLQIRFENENRLLKFPTAI